MKEMNDYKERLKNEKIELDLKIEKLQKFIENKDSLFTSLVAPEQADLLRQIDVMREYSSILQKRINRL